jgi:hypothetical protein
MLKRLRPLAVGLAGILLLGAVPQPAARATRSTPPAKIRVTPAPSTGRELLALMRQRYDGRWFTTLRFTQKTTMHAANGSTSESLWYESVRSTPSGTQLRIDIGDPAQGNGVLYTADSLWQFRGGKLLGARAGGNTLLPLIQSVYVQPVERTVSDLRATGVDLARTLVSRSWQGKSVWVVGATSAGDSLSPQFWVEQDRLAVVRAIFSPVAGAPVMDLRFDKLVPLAGGWLATYCTFFVGGKLQQVEEYQDWHANVELSPALFAAETWTTAPHWARTGKPSGTSTHALVGSWDVDVVAGHRKSPDGTVSPLMSKGVFTFSAEGDSLVVSMQVTLSASGKPTRLAIPMPRDTATFVRAGETVQAVKGDQNTLGKVSIVSTFQFVAVGDSLIGSLKTASDGTNTDWPIRGARRR